MKTESMIKQAVSEDLKDKECEKKITKKEMASIKGGKEVNPATIRDIDMAKEMINYDGV